MMLKLCGAVLVMAGSTGLGFLMARQWKMRLHSLETLKRLVYLLRGEILYANAPLMEAFSRIGEKDDAEIGQLFSRVAGRIEMQEGQPFSQLWKEEVDKLGRESSLTKEDRQELKTLGQHLGYLDRTMQERTIALFLDRLDFTISYLREHEREKSRLYTSLGIMGGLFLTIVLY